MEFLYYVCNVSQRHGQFAQSNIIMACGKCAIISPQIIPHMYMLFMFFPLQYIKRSSGHSHMHPVFFSYRMQDTFISYSLLLTIVSSKVSPKSAMYLCVHTFQWSMAGNDKVTLNMYHHYQYYMRLTC